MFKGETEEYGGLKKGKNEGGCVRVLRTFNGHPPVRKALSAKWGAEGGGRAENARGDVKKNGQGRGGGRRRRKRGKEKEE